MIRFYQSPKKNNEHFYKANSNVELLLFCQDEPGAAAAQSEAFWEIKQLITHIR